MLTANLRSACPAPRVCAATPSAAGASQAGAPAGLVPASQAKASGGQQTGTMFTGTMSRVEKVVGGPALGVGTGIRRRRACRVGSCVCLMGVSFLIYIIASMCPQQHCRRVCRGTGLGG